MRSDSFSAEHRLPACCRRQLAGDLRGLPKMPRNERSISFSAGCRKGQAVQPVLPGTRKPGHGFTSRAAQVSFT